VEYYKGLCVKTNEHFKAQGVPAPYPTPPIVIESVNINETRKLRGRDGDEDSWERFDRVFREAFLRLQNAGADFGVIASNTPHMRLHGITRGLDFPVVSILDATAQAVRDLGGKRALILGTSVTMSSPVYGIALEKYGIEVLPGLDPKLTSELDRLIDIDLFQGKIEGASERILRICRERVNDPAKDIICLACTELPLAFPEHKETASFQVDGMWFVNTTVVHIDAILRETLA
jgi:aspartate racemase